MLAKDRDEHWIYLMSRRAEVQKEVQRFLELDQRQYAAAALAIAVNARANTVSYTLGALLERGEIVARKINRQGFLYRHKTASATCDIVQVKMVRCLVVNGKALRILGE